MGKAQKYFRIPHTKKDTNYTGLITSCKKKHKIKFTNITNYYGKNF